MWAALGITRVKHVLAGGGTRVATTEELIATYPGLRTTARCQGRVRIMRDEIEANLRRWKDKLSKGMPATVKRNEFRRDASGQIWRAVWRSPELRSVFVFMSEWGPTGCSFSCLFSEFCSAALRRLLALRTSTRGIASTSTLTGCAKGSQAQLGLRLVPPQSTCRWRTVERAVGHDEHDVICRRILFKQMLSAQNRP